MKLLLVDDEPDIRLLLKRFFRKEGHDITVVGSLKDARALFQDGFSPDIVLLDINLGDGSGLELIDEILFVSPGASIIVLSAYLQQIPEANREDMPLFGTLAKPFDFQELLEMVNATQDKTNGNV